MTFQNVGWGHGERDSNPGFSDTSLEVAGCVSLGTHFPQMTVGLIRAVWARE